jgi:hypothetical protein
MAIYLGCDGNVMAMRGGQDLGVRTDAEMLVYSGPNLYSVFTGFNSDPTSLGFVASYMTRRLSFSSSDSCSPISGNVYHYCGIRAETNLQLTAYAGWTPHAFSGLYTWVRLGGIWIGDSTGGGSGHNHQTDLSYDGVGANYGAAPYIRSDTYAVYYRSKTNAGSSKFSCADHYASGARISGVYTIDRGSGAFDIYCDMAVAGGGWDLVSVYKSSPLVVC